MPLRMQLHDVLSVIAELDKYNGATCHNLMVSSHLLQEVSGSVSLIHNYIFYNMYNTTCQLNYATKYQMSGAC